MALQPKRPLDSGQFTELCSVCCIEFVAFIVQLWASRWQKDYEDYNQRSFGCGLNIVRAQLDRMVLGCVCYWWNGF